MIKYFKQIIFFLLVLCLSCKESTEKKNKELYKKHSGYTINGILSKGKAKYVYLLDKKGVKIDSSVIKNYSFSLNGVIKEPDIYYLQVKNTSNKYPIILENNNYKMLLNSYEAMIIGGKLHTIFTDYQSKKIQYTKQKSDYLERFSKLNLGLGPYLKAVDSIRKIESKFFTDFIIDNNKNVLSSILLEQSNLSSKQAIKLKRKLEDKKIKRYLIRQLDLMIDDIKLAEAEEKILRRKPTPLFSGVNLLGKQTHLEKIIKGKKAFLIDFWASWCPPCRETSFKLKELYTQYSRKGFDILTVSEDRSVTEWKNGIYIDEIESWHHIYDDFNRISSMFGVGALPHMVLIDENGKIIKNNISFSHLKEELKNIFDNK